MTKKVAILGSAPSSVLLAPFGDPTWDIWGCSPGCYPVAKRVDRWFEIHRYEPGQPWFSPEYIQYMARFGGPVYMVEPVKDIPNSEYYPLDRVLNHVYAHIVDGKGVWREKRFDRSDFSSTIAWMIALAIVEGYDEIGLWGVDMSAQEEWFFQRSGCQSLIDAAKSIGIAVRVPCESDLLRPPPLYGFCEIDPAHIKGLARKRELEARIQNVVIAGQNAQREADHLRGALDQLEYNMKTWVGNPFHLSLDLHGVVAPQQFGGDVGGDIEVGGGIKVEPEFETIPEGPLPPPASVMSDDWRTLETSFNLKPMGPVSSVPPSTLAELSEALYGAARVD